CNGLISKCQPMIQHNNTGLFLCIGDSSPLGDTSPDQGGSGDSPSTRLVGDSPSEFALKHYFLDQGQSTGRGTLLRIRGTVLQSRQSGDGFQLGDGPSYQEAVLHFGGQFFSKGTVLHFGGSPSGLGTVLP